MAEEKEASFPVNTFAGINRNADRENMAPNEFYQLSNLWERRLGTLETRNGSTDVVATRPGGVVAYDNIFKIYKSSGSNKRITAIETGNPLLPQVGYATNLTGRPEITLSWVTDSNAFWNNQITIGSSVFNFNPEQIVVRLVGYGTDLIYTTPASGITGYLNNTNQHLRVQVTSALPSGVTGIELLARVPCGSTRTIGAVSSISNYQYRHVWFGFIDMNGKTTSDTSFPYAPYGTDPSYTFPVTIPAVTKIPVALTASNDGTASLVAGKTYYVLVAPQFAVLATGNAARMSYCVKGVNPSSTDVIPITIPTGTAATGKIFIDFSQAGHTACNCIFIGEHPQLLQPVGIVNDPAFHSNFFITSLPAGNPAVMGINTTNATASATSNDYSFNFSNYSKTDMFMRINDDNTTVPCFAGRMYQSEGSYWDTGYDQFGQNPAGPDFGSARQYVPDLITNILTIENLGTLGIQGGFTYRFTQWQNLALVTCASPGLIPTGGVPSNYFVTDGRVLAPVVMDFQTTTAANVVTLPNAKYISVYQDSVIVGGGAPGIDPVNFKAISSARSFYISRTGTFSDFTIAGTAAPILNFLTLDPNVAENLDGFGFYTNTTSQLGPLNKFAIFTKNSTWLVDDLPTFDASGNIVNLASINLRQLSRKVGAVSQDTVAYTPVGTIFCGLEGVFLLREDGEPTPVGQSLIDIFRLADLSRASACYHDKHYKLSFYHPDYDPGGGHPPNVPTVNNCEFWLNINKMVQQKGKEDWTGPFIGRSVQYCFVEEKDGDALTNGIPRDRYVSSAQVIYKADVEPAVTATVINDVIGGTTTPVTTIFESKDLQISQQDQNWNKVIKRWFWKIRTNAEVGSPLSLTDKTWLDGALVDSQTITTFSANTLNFRDQQFNLVRVFPLTRIRGRVIRKQLTTATRVAYDGFQVNYEIERRRPG